MLFVTGVKLLSQAASSCGPFVYLLFEDLLKAGTSQVAKRMFEHRKRLDGDRRATDRTRLLDSAGDESLLRAALTITLDGGGGIQVAKTFEHAERTDGHRSTSVERHEMEEALLAGRQFVLAPHRVAELISPSHNLTRVHLTDIEFRIKSRWL